MESLRASKIAEVLILLKAPFTSKQATSINYRLCKVFSTVSTDLSLVYSHGIKLNCFLEADPGSLISLFHQAGCFFLPYDQIGGSKRLHRVPITLIWVIWSQ